MRIVILADRLIMGGLETHIVTFSNELLRRGHCLLLYTAATVPEIIAQIQDHDHQFKSLFWTDHPLEDIREFQADIIHAHPFTAIAKGYEIAEKLQKPLIITMHGLYDFGLDRSPLGYQVSEKVQTIIAVDNAVANVLKHSTPYPEKIKVIPNGIDLSFFQPQPFKSPEFKIFGFGREWPTLTVISRFDDGKERPIKQLLRVIPILAESLSGLHLILVGDGSRLAELQVMAAQINQNSDKYDIRFVGRQIDVRRFIADSDLCLACDRAALEAMACRRPVLAMNAAGFAGVIDNSNFTAILLNRSNYREFSDSELVTELLHLLKNKLYCLELADKGLEIVQQHFNIQEAVTQLEKVFRSNLQPSKEHLFVGGY